MCAVCHGGCGSKEEEKDERSLLSAFPWTQAYQRHRCASNYKLGSFLPTGGGGAKTAVMRCHSKNQACMIG